MGGWGDPSKDFSVTDGAFSNFSLSYPSPHILRRNFTLQPYQTWANFGPLRSFVRNPDKYINETFTPNKIDELINGYVGDFEGFVKDFQDFHGAHGDVLFPFFIPFSCVHR